MKDPIVIDPPGFDQSAAWKECSDEVDRCGGLERDGEVNWRAAFSADPGICSCPSCHTSFWAWGSVQKCTECGFEYPTDAWAMFSWGVQAAWNPELRREHPQLERLHQRRLEHAYYRYGFENPPPNGIKLFELFEANDWRQMLSNPDRSEAR